MKRFLLIIIAVMLAIAALPAHAAEKSEYWALDQLLRLGAIPPVYNATAKRYEISTPAQLMFLSGEWKEKDTNEDGNPDAPRNGHYVLMNDIDMAPLMRKLGRMPPLAYNQYANANGSDGSFEGIFDGQYFAILNLRVISAGKCAGLFAYAGGEEGTQAQIKNLALINVRITGSGDVAAIAGISAAEITNCTVTGEVENKGGKDLGSTAGGLVGRLRRTNDGTSGRVENCTAYVGVSGAHTVGGIVGMLDGGGFIKNSYAAGKLSCVGENARVGGIAGAYEAGEGITGCAALHKELKGENGAYSAGRLFGYSTDIGAEGISNNIAFMGTPLLGSPPTGYLGQVQCEEQDAQRLTDSMSFTQRLGWDFQNTFAWDAAGYPVLKGFLNRGNNPKIGETILKELVYKQPVLSGYAVPAQVCAPGEPVMLRAFLHVGDEVVDTVRVYYGKEANRAALTDYIEFSMIDEGAGYACALPTEEPGVLYYYFSAVVDGKALNYPNGSNTVCMFTIQTPVFDGAPYQITLTPGTNPDEMYVNWLSAPEIRETTLQYREVGEKEWLEQNGTGDRHFTPTGCKVASTHNVLLSGLKPGTRYEYRVAYLGRAYVSPVQQFKTMPEGNFTLLVASDLHAQSAEESLNYAAMLGYARSANATPDALLFTGGLVQNGYSDSEWATLFDSLEQQYATLPAIHLQSERDYWGDPDHAQFGARFPLPTDSQEISNESGSAAWFEMGDACIVLIDDGYHADTARLDSIRAQLNWAEQAFAQSGKKWRILACRTGPYVDAWEDVAVRHILREGCDKLRVDLFINGRGALARTTMSNNQQASLGAGTTYITGGSVNPKTLGTQVEGLSSSAVLPMYQTISVSKEGIRVCSYALQASKNGTEPDWTKWELADEFFVSQSLSVPPKPIETPQLDAAEVVAPPRQEENTRGALALILVLAIAIATALWSIYYVKPSRK